jgi:4-hydroxymandelate oxidase
MFQSSIDDSKGRLRTNTADRRQFLSDTALLGAGVVAAQLISAKPLEAQTSSKTEGPPVAEAVAIQPARRFGPKGVPPSVAQVYQQAREALYPRCRVCPQCDGVACAGEFPGFGGLGTGTAFQNNFNALRQITLRSRPLRGVLNVDRPPDTSMVLFGQKLSFPAMAAPIGLIASNFGTTISDTEYFEAIIGGCVDTGTLGAFGDAPPPLESDELLQGRFNTVAKNGGRAIAGIKPRPQANFIEIIRRAEAANVAVITIDIDAAGRYGESADKRTQMGPKTASQLRELVKATNIPLVVKGIMTPEDALLAMDAGAAGIVVSSHGGRVLDYTPGTATVLPGIADKVGGQMPILVDGCVHYGVDIAKYLALGANGVLVGRHLARAAFGGGRSGVRLFMDTMHREFEIAMVMMGAADVHSIDRSVLA